jgi:hypothetical protein
VRGALVPVFAHIAGDIAVLPDSSLAWAYTAATPDYSSAPAGSSPTSRTDDRVPRTSEGSS